MEGFRLQTSDFRPLPSDGHVDDRTVVWKSVARSMKDGFTLVELMLVISIIGILAGVSISVTRQVYHTARVAKTESTITKIDLVLLERYADFENRRVPSPNFGSSPMGSQVTQAARLWLLRDMIRMEMPTNRAEIEAEPIQFKFRVSGEPWLLPHNGSSQNNNWDYSVVLDDSPLRQLYYDAIQSCNGDFESAKCLYLVVTYGNPETRELFKDNEIATDEDGLSYFVDGWGNPIYFLRWAPGLVMSERQPNVLAPKQNADDWVTLTDQQKHSIATSHPDPLDPTEVGGVLNLASDSTTDLGNGRWEIDLTAEWQYRDSNNNNIATPVRGWALLPVVLSSGGVREDTDEKMFGIKLIPDNGTIPIVDPFHWPIGAPSPNYRNHAIIHNHSTRR